MFYIHENAPAHALCLTGMVFGRIKTVLLGYWQKYDWVTFTLKHNFGKILRENPWRKPTPHTTTIHTPGFHTMNVKGENKRDERHRIIIYTADCIFRLTKNSIKYQNTLAQSQKLLAFGRLCAIQFNSFASSFFCTAACPVGYCAMKSKLNAETIHSSLCAWWVFFVLWLCSVSGRILCALKNVCCANKIGSMKSMIYWKRNCVRSTKHTHTQKIKRKVQNTRIDWFGSRIFWPSSILLQMIKRHTSTKKIQPTKININTKVWLDNVLFFRIRSNYHQRIKSPKKHGHCFPQANLISKVFWEQYSKHIVFQSIHNFFSLKKKKWIYLLYYYQIYINLWWWVCEPLTLSCNGRHKHTNNSSKLHFKY